MLFSLAVSLVFSMWTVSCKKAEQPSEQTPNENGGEEIDTKLVQTRKAVNYFGKNVMNTYYLWNSEISRDIVTWGLDEDPVAKVKQIRYKEDGKDFDRWTQITDDFESFTSSVAGISETYGYDVTLYLYGDDNSEVVAVITYVYAGSPAEKAGLKRGDAIQWVNGKKMFVKNNKYVHTVNYELFNSKEVEIKLVDGTEIKLVAEEMYEDPVHLAKTLDIAGKKVGYLHFTSFTLKACDRLVEVCRSFKADAIEELILDLRYNGGGYVFTQQVLASMLAPDEVVRSGAVLEKNIYNAILTEAFKDDLEVKFSYSHEITSSGVKYSYNTEDANIGIKKIWVIYDSGSASASESLVTCLMPYIPITIVGQKSHGKFCSGIMISSPDWYDDYKSQIDQTTYANGKRYSQNWGIYVMIGRFADKNGNTPCMPDGFTPDYPAMDNPKDGIPLGDPDESMLSVVVSLINGQSASASGSQARRRGPDNMTPMDVRVESPSFGKYILIPRNIPQGRVEF